MTRTDFDDWMRRLVDPSGAGAAAAVALRDDLIYAAGYGLADVEWSTPIDTDTVFRIASVTKQFTAAAILRLAESGKLAIADPIERHLPAFPIGRGRITVRQLLNHTSGVGDYTSDPRFMSTLVRRDNALAELVDVIAGLPPDFEPGARYLYNNSGYVLLAAIIEVCSGRDYATYLRETFFEPLGMTHTCYLYDASIVPKRARGYVRGRELSNAPMLSMNNPHGAGGLGSTVGDLLIWERALRRGRVVSAEAYRAMTTPHSTGPLRYYGLGLTRHVVRGQTVIGHGGNINGFVSHLAHWPEYDLTVVVLANSNPFPVEQAAFGLARRAIGQADAVYPSVRLGPPALAACAGEFRFPNTEMLKLSVADGALASAFPRPNSVFRPKGNGGFFLADDPEVTFRFEDAARDSLVLQDYRLPMRANRHAP